MGKWRLISTLLISASIGSEMSAIHSSYFIPEEGAPASHWLRGCLGPRAYLNSVTKTIHYPCREWNPGHPVCSKSHLPAHPV